MYLAILLVWFDLEINALTVCHHDNIFMVFVHLYYISIFCILCRCFFFYKYRKIKLIALSFTPSIIYHYYTIIITTYRTTNSKSCSSVTPTPTIYFRRRTQLPTLAYLHVPKTFLLQGRSCSLLPSFWTIAVLELFFFGGGGRGGVD